MRGKRRSRWVIVTCRAACVLLASLVSACSSSEEASPQLTLTSPTQPTPATSPTPPDERLQLSGRVLDQNGTPVPGVLVVADYGGGSPSAPCHVADQLCWLAAKTNDLGEYLLQFDARTWPGGGSGFVYTFREGYEVDVQWVPTGPPPAVRDLRVRATRPIPAGESIVVSVDATSSLCTDLEDLLLATMGNRCEIVVIESGAGMLHVEARPVDGGPAPSMFWYTSGNYAGRITRPAPGAVAIPVRGGTYRILVGVPEGAPSQQFNVTTTLR
jgi:hypothetical protein